MKKIEVQVVALMSGPSGFTVVLGEIGGKKRKLPIMIGPFEMHSLAVFMEKISRPRPMTHDLTISLIENLGYSIEEVMITELDQNGTYLASIFLNGAEIDSRPSDAINLALRANAPIYVLENVFDESDNIIKEEESKNKLGDKRLLEGPKKEPTIEDLSRALAEAVRKEDYETAAKIRDMIKKRNPKKN